MLRNCARSPGEQRLRQQRVGVADEHMVGEVAVRDEGADADAAVGAAFHILEWQPRHVDDQGRRRDVPLHQIENVGSAGDERDVGASTQANRFVDGGGALILEIDHVAVPSATARTAVTMLE